MSRAFHAKCAGQADAAKLLALLTDDEREEVASWQLPAALMLEGGVLLDYPSAEKEVELALNRFGMPCDFEDPNALIRGRMDFGWIRNGIAYVEDIKKSLWTSSDGPESLQLQGYGFAYGRLMGAEGYCTGIWAATEGEHVWSRETVMFESERAEQLWESIYHAATNETGKFTTGDHCKRCYARLHCPEFLLPAATLTAADLAYPDGDDLLDPTAYGERVDRIQRLMALGETYLDTLKEHVRRGQLKVIHEGKMWAPVKDKKGRRYIDKEKVAAAVADIEQVMSTSEPRTSFRWVNAK